MGSPAEELVGKDAGRAEEALGELRVGKERVSAFGAAEGGWLAEESAELIAKVADAERFASRDVDNERRRGGVSERLQGNGVGVALPDDVDGGHREVDG